MGDQVLYFEDVDEGDEAPVRSRVLTRTDLVMYAGASGDYNPAPGLDRIRARVLAINSADDERNPAELGQTAAAVKTLKDGRYYEIPVGPETRGHGTTGNAKLWAGQLRAFLAGK